MIRINLLGVERPRARKPITFDTGQRVTLAGSVIAVLAVLVMGGWYWSLDRTSTQLDADLVTARQEATRLRALLAEVQQYEARREQLRQRVSLITRLRSGQSMPVQLLDHVSRSVPDMLWLTALEQEGEQVTIEGRSTTLIALSDFVGNLSGGAVLQKPIEIVNSQVQPASNRDGEATPELIQFAVRARVSRPDGAAAAAEQPAAGRGRAAPRARGRQAGAR